ncbi:unnamed protein product [Mucor hiemalis]
MDNKQQNFNNQPVQMSQPYPQQPGVVSNQPYSQEQPGFVGNQQQPYSQQQPGFVGNQQQPPQAYGYNNQQQGYSGGYQPPPTDQKVPFTNDMKQPGTLPGYGAESSGMTPMQREQQQVQQQMQQAKSSGGYPGVVGGTPAASKGITGYDAQGNPIIPPFIAQRHQIEQSLGPTCKDGGYHDLRMLLTNSSLLFAVLIIPYCCGYRGKRVCTCTKCKQKFPNILLPSA